jgi:Glycosyltransferases involved in cell wall biogenesis
MNENQIAVVCPTYNSAGYISRTLNSLLSQQELPEEIIFSDDASQDNTIDIIEQSREQFENAGIELKVLFSHYNKGPGAARNQGIFATQKHWIAFLDADDTWKPEKIKRIKKIIRITQGLNCILHWEDYVRLNGKVTTLKHGENYEQNISIPKQIYLNNFLSTSAVVCSRSLLIKVGCFDEKLPNGQDYDLWLKMSSLRK